MSIALYLVRLWWDGQRGQARYHGEPISLAHCPPLGQRLDAIDYAPAAGVRLIQPYAEAWRDLTDTEESRVLVYLRGICRAGKA